MTNHDSDYDQWAWLYDKTLGPDYSAQKLGFLDKVLLSKLPTGAPVLDLCCGTGQMSAPLVQRGFQVVGLDISADMLKYAAKNARGATFVQDDARDFTFDTLFGGVICASASLNHMASADDLSAVFTSVNHALQMDGLFVFDINHPAQMSRHWRNQPAAGEIADDYAWLITPRYDPKTATGAFRVDMYRRPAEIQLPALSKLMDKLTRLPLFWRLKLPRLAKFATSHPGWAHNGNDYQVFGHDLDSVSALLRAAGFDVTLQTLQGKPDVGDADAACFVCRKVAQASATREAAE